MTTPNLPEKLTATAKFCTWKREARGEGGHLTKVPYNPVTGRHAMSNDASTFGTFIQACAALPGYDGIGIGVFDNICAIDIDNCYDDMIGLSEAAEDIVRSMNCYTEFSPSGRGVRLLFTLRADYSYNRKRYYIMNRARGLEIYAAGCTQKFVTVTGNAYPGTPFDLLDRTDALTPLLEKYMVRLSENGEAPPEHPDGQTRLTDEELISIALRNPKFNRLFNGDYSEYPSGSEGDLALFSIMAFYSRGDVAQMRRILKRCATQRDKWQRDDYIEHSFEKAISTLTTWYDPGEYARGVAESALESFGEDNDGRLEQWKPETNKRYAWNDMGNGRLFADWYKDVARYVPERKKWFVYDGVAWRPDLGNLMVMELCKRLADLLLLYAASIRDEDKRMTYLKHIARWQTRKTRNTILEDASSVYPVALSQFDANPWLFNCRNGTLDLKSRTFHDHRAGDFLSKIASVDYNPEARSERWSQFVTEVMRSSTRTENADPLDDEAVDSARAVFLQKALGYALTGDTSRECFFILYGPTTRNGKGTTMETIIRMMGDYGTTCRPDTIAQRRGSNASGPNEDVARLAGARFVNISEPDKRMVLSSALVKTLTGGDTITARYLNENSFEYRPQFKLFVNTNHLPSVTDNTLFTSDRVMTIPFEHHFTDDERDPRLKAELSQDDNLSGILNWCIEGLRMLDTEGLNPPKSVMLATDEYRKSNDKIGRFIDEELVSGPGFTVPTMELYNRYRAWCEVNGVLPESSENVKNELGMRMTITRMRIGTAQRTVVVGYKLREETAAGYQAKNRPGSSADGL